MGLRTGNDVPTSRTKPMPMVGMLRRNKSGDGLTAVLPPTRNSANKLSKSALHKIFAAMLGVVFICYCLLMVMMMRHHDQSVFDTEGKWGPAITKSSKVLRDHIQNLVDERRKTTNKEVIGHEEKRDSDFQSSDKAQEVAVGGSGNFFENLEETDIHDMRPPEANQQSKAQKGHTENSTGGSLPMAHASREKNSVTNVTSLGKTTNATTAVNIDLNEGGNAVRKGGD